MISVEVIHNNIDRALKQLKAKSEMTGESLHAKARSLAKPSERKKMKMAIAETRTRRAEAKKINNKLKWERLQTKRRKGK